MILTSDLPIPILPEAFDQSVDQKLIMIEEMKYLDFLLNSDLTTAVTAFEYICYFIKSIKSVLFTEFDYIEIHQVIQDRLDYDVLEMETLSAYDLESLQQRVDIIDATLFNFDLYFQYENDRYSNVKRCLELVMNLYN
jgi:hypothetical protein